MTKEEMTELARGNVERNLSDAVTEDGEGLSEEALADLIYDEAYTLGLDALLDAGVERHAAITIAIAVAQCFACP
jgi:hypothetical protein